MTFRERLADWISGGQLSECRKECIRLRLALAKIEQQQTPGANATVTRMARIAREALDS